MKSRIRLKINLIDNKTSQPLSLRDYKVNFWDHDIVKDDFLGSAVPDESGNATITINPTNLRSFDSPFEIKPDIYFTVEKNHSLIYKSPVLKNLNYHEAFDYADFTLFCYDLGSFAV